jgi:hypothetical protein
MLEAVDKRGVLLFTILCINRGRVHVYATTKRGVWQTEEVIWRV